MQKKLLFKILVILFLIGDLGYTFCQFYQKPLDGDMAAIILPSEWYSPVLQDPFGFKFLKTGEGHAASNRYFANQTLRVYFRSVPLFFNRFLEPVKSLYFSHALFFWLTHLLLLLVISKMVLANFARQSISFIMILLLVCPLFQTNGYQTYMGLVPGSVAYASAYAFPMIFVLLYFYPFFNLIRNNKLQIWYLIWMIPLSVFLAFNGPIISPVCILISGFLILYFLLHFRKEFLLPIVILIFFVLMCLYSFYVGTFNAENGSASTVAQRYDQMIRHLLPYFTRKLGLPLLAIGIIMNNLLLRKHKVYQILKQGHWLLLFSVVYILLLPLGGYREYRPNAIRFDTLLPVTLALVYYFCLTSSYLYLNLKGKQKQYFKYVLVACLFIFTIADQAKWGHNRCEKEALYSLHHSKETITILKSDCTLMNWDVVSDPEYSKLNAELFQYWGITKEQHLYYQK